MSNTSNTSNSELPDSWISTHLENVVERRRSREDPKDYPDLPYIGLKHIKEERIGLHGKSRSGDYQSTSVHFLPGDVLYGRLRPYLNKVHLADFEGLGSGEIIVLNPIGDMFSRYIAHLLNSQEFVRYANQRSTGDRPRVNFNKIKEFDVPVPPLAEQQRIVAKIEELISKLDSGVDELEDTGKRLGHYQRSVLKAAISGRISERWREVEQREHSTFNQENSNQYQDIQDAETKHDYPETWRVTTLDQISDVETGATPLRGNNEYWGGDIPWVKSGAVNKAKIREAEEFISQKALDDTSVEILPPGTLVVAMYGATRGKHSILEIEATTNQACAGVILSKEFSFLRSWIDIYLSHNYEILKSKGAGGAQINLNLGIIRSIEIPLPPENEIEHICDIVERRMSIINETGRTVSKCLNHAKRLRQSILKHAFEGNLVPQEPTEKTSATEGKDTNFKTGSQATFPEVTSDVE